MRPPAALLPTTAVAIALAGVSVQAVTGASAAGRTSLTIVVRKDGRAPGTESRHSLRCDPVGGTHPTRAAACKGLARLGRSIFRPVPADTVCAELFGGPDTALVTGIVGGRPVWARFARDNACQIERWDRASFLLPRR
jgi:hypothetical protein